MAKKRIWFHGFSGLLHPGVFWWEEDGRRVGEFESYSRVIVIVVVTFTDITIAPPLENHSQVTR